MQKTLQLLGSYVSILVFVALNVAAVVGMFLVVPTTRSLLLGATLFLVACFGVTAGAHRHFTHMSFKCSRVFSFILAIAAALSFQGSLFEWVSKHREHHLYSDEPGDPHSPVRKGGWWQRFCGFFWAYIGWLLVPRKVNLELIKDIRKKPELCWLSRLHALPGICVAGAYFLIDEWSGVVWGFLVPTFALYVSAFLVNSLCHLFGSHPYKVEDNSRNIGWLAPFGLGEHWHHNHHAFPASARFGLRWYQIDIAWYLLCGFSLLGLVWDLHQPTAEEIEAKLLNSDRELVTSS